MNSAPGTDTSDPSIAPAPTPAPVGPSLAGWLREGLRASVFLRPRVAGWHPTVAHLLVLLALLCAIELGLARLEIAGPARFDLRGWLAPWWATGAMALLVWSVLPRPAEAARPAGIGSWLALWFVAIWPATILSHAIGLAEERGALPWVTASPGLAWGIYLGFWAWTLGMALRLGRHFGVPGLRQTQLAAGLMLIFGLSAWLFPDRPWESEAQVAAPPPRLELNQATIEAQQQTLQRSVDALAAERPGVIDVYGLVFAPYADEDVFLRESTMVASVLAERFDAAGRVLQLVNHATTAERLPWATPLNLRRAVEALAARMDREQDLLVLYLTSHGAQDFQLAATHGPLQVEPVSPRDVREALDAAGIRHRVVVVSACYSGGWVGPLGGDHTLVMTAADATRTSYGCGRLSELTFFGRAVFHEALRRTHSLEDAFAQAVPLIRQREIDAGKPDGFSNPQISVGEKIRPLLAALTERLGAAAPR